MKAKFQIGDKVRVDYYGIVFTSTVQFVYWSEKEHSYIYQIMSYLDTLLDVKEEYLSKTK
jgi:hypothetical protein